ncbi:GNAT family N-acetyltransferase [Streptomyces sp. HPF1205]|uniref:GNAT family N-acetyltransferase n=1 Tax=Streptomyces sp. HPF1205 TaxID=2873262 RepID=UPI001CED8252|nr:GNAT family N-acetyltransferase [Streptomyces sp. HPF1205]
MTVELRAVTEADLPFLFEVQSGREGQWMAAFTDPRTASDLDAYLLKWRRLLADDTVVARAVVAGGEIVGSVGCFEMDGETEVTYWIREDRWGRGLATAALSALLTEVTTRPLYGRAAADNAGSVKVLERNGFVAVGEDEGYAEARGAVTRELVFRLEAAG